MLLVILRIVTSTDSRIFKEIQNDLSNSGAQQRVHILSLPEAKTLTSTFDNCECRYTHKAYC